MRFITDLLFDWKSGKAAPAISAPAHCNREAKVGAAKCCRDGERASSREREITEKAGPRPTSLTPLPPIHDGSIIPEGALAMRPSPRKLRLPPDRSEATTFLADWNGFAPDPSGMLASS
jgi:hypothetical protein